MTRRPTTQAEQLPLTLGDIVLIKPESPTGGGERAYVYDTYEDFDDPSKNGVCLITESGNDTGGWSWAEQGQYVEFVVRSGFYYKFVNVIQLDRDFKAGVFTDIFKRHGTS